MNAKDLIRHELIGLDIEVVKAKNPSLKGIKGKVVDETKSTITIKEKNKMKRINNPMIVAYHKFQFLVLG